ncbi:C40 family peptidase [Cupriavidus metallidurans]|uniref:C40 family peptidase n=1 Tax=Cupriavidus metallidurans TaxID=119219 RepID=UPI001CD02E4F|nr:C40 family peptidase [Cupriavidus metallidurans]UBM12752.1 C40 family peptidase [Cupriavidus metallidurans]
MRKHVIKAIREHAEREYPRECCGIVLRVDGRDEYVPCTNLASGTEHFVLDHREYAAAEDRGEVVTIVHSHPNIPATPSQADRVSCERTGLPWLIMNWPTGEYTMLEPSGYLSPLMGRPFAHGVLDCYAFIRDYYRETLSIDLPDFERRDEWWLKGENLYLDNFEKAGFVSVPPATLCHHDVVLMQVASGVPNHAAVFQENGTILQHCIGRLSGPDVYGGYWRKVTVKVLRHKDLIHA